MKVIVKYQAKPQYAQALEKTLREIIAPVRSERGCVQFDVHMSLDQRLVFFVDQLWESQERWEQFNNSERMHLFNRTTEGLVDEYTVCTSNH